MKRIVLRVGALVTVVVLGVIAIAQAQRGAGDADSPSEEKTAFTPNTVEEPTAQPIAAPAITGVNPLRSAKASDASAPSGMFVGDDRAAGTEPGPSTVAPPSMNPFARATSSDRPNPVRPVSAEEPADDAGTATVPPARLDGDDGRYNSMPPTMPGTPAVLSSPPASMAAMTPPPDRYTEPTQPPAEPSEPGRFVMDSPATPASPGNSGMLPFDRSEPTLAPKGGAMAMPNTALRGGFASTSDSGPGLLGPDSPMNSPATASGIEGTGKPGSKQLEGPQTPQVTIQKTVPDEIQVGKEATFRITVQNSGSVAAHGVEVHDVIPQGTQLVDTAPKASQGPNGELVWDLGTMRPGNESSVEIRLMPVAEGEVGSVATVTFRADASARCIATKPELVVETSAEDSVLIGEDVTLTIKVSNPGSGTATGVVLEEHIPAGLEHPAGDHLEYEVGDLPPGESRQLELTLKAGQPGPIVNTLVARGDGNLRIEDRLEMSVVAPELQVGLDGPKRRYLERQATYQLSVHNPGTAAAEQVELVAYLPAGLKFVSANNAGFYEETDRSIRWRLEELPVNETGTVEIVTMPVEAGQQKIRVESNADKGLTAEAEQPVLVEGIAAIMFEVVDITDPIEVGGETTYEIRVLNQGSKAATNLRLAVVLPPELQPVSAEGPARYAIQGNQIQFQGLARLAPKADTTYRVRAKGLQPGDLRTRVQLMTDEMDSPVTKETSTRVYADE